MWVTSHGVYGVYSVAEEARRSTGLQHVVLYYGGGWDVRPFDGTRYDNEVYRTKESLQTLTTTG
jgi:hypothetical protein